MAQTQQEKLQHQKGVLDRRVETIEGKIKSAEEELKVLGTQLDTAKAEQAWYASHPLLQNQEGPASAEDGTNDPAAATSKDEDFVAG